ncbi:MAG: hypothetical protein LBT25_00195 [Candidatus Symbiothrix sp.]|jgi:Gpi18-like mannosyltransferase|nr:hypothetical protein [Candidatus Symbiothrix sp.]
MLLKQIRYIVKNTIGFIERRKVFSVVLLVIFALLLRLPFFDYESGDYRLFLSNWCDVIVNHGGWHSWKASFHNYQMPYIYLLTLFVYLPIKNLYAIKLLSLIFDFTAAFFVYKIVGIKYKNKFGIPLVAAMVFLCAPTIWLNSSAWGQCDVIYTTFLLMSCYCCLKQKYFLTFLFFGIAFTFKAQAFFFAPVLFILWYNKRFNPLYFLIIPGIYLIAVLPAFFAGRGLWDLLTIYIWQSETYNNLNRSAPNPYLFISDQYYDTLLLPGLILAFVLMCLAIYFIIKKNKNISTEKWVEIIVFFLLFIPYILPKMHDRFFYPADTFSIVYAFYFVKKYYVALFTIGGSLLVYPIFIHNGSSVPEYGGTFLTSFALFFMMTFVFAGSDKNN